jgi:hypothetical protein
MANNIKIVGEIINTQRVPRYSEDDLNLLSPQLQKEDFGQQNDYIEYFVYDAGGTLLNVNYSYKDFKLPNTSYIDPTSGSLPIIEIDPVRDLQNLGYSSGEFKVQYNFFNNKISNSSQAGLFTKEISADRTELRLGSTVLTNEQIESGSLELINSYSGSLYFVDYLLNFGNNFQAVATNTALNKIDSGYEVLFKLYQPLPDTIQIKSTLWVVDEKVDPYIFDINLDKLITPLPGPQLRGPNFDIDVPNQNNIGTPYQTYTNLINSVQNISTASYQQLLSLITSQSIDINTDYTDYNNFVVFSSAKQRIINFYNKVKQIEDYQNNIINYTLSSSQYPLMVKDLNDSTASINNIIANFDGFEYYLYFESGSTLTSSIEYNITPYPKIGTLLPYSLQSTGSSEVETWYGWATSSADNYDDQNQNNLVFTVPTFIKDDGNNEPYLTFLNMVGHYFDNIWIYLQALTDINLTNNNLEKGISKDLVYYVLESLGTKLYNQYGDVDNLEYLVGNSGSANFDNNFTYTGSYLNTIPRKDLVAEAYKRIYHNLPLLMKTRGTSYGLQTLVSTFGITSSVLPIKEYGGDLKSNTLDEFNNDKIRIVSNSIVGRPLDIYNTASVLSPYIRLYDQPINPTDFRTNDLHYVDISFSPQDKIDIYSSASIVANNPSWSIDDFIGDPRFQYNTTYPTLEVERHQYLSPLSASLIPYTSSVDEQGIAATDYNSFIRLIQFFDNSLFKMLKDFVPARTSLSTGVTISSPILERNKWVYANPSSTSEIEVETGTIEGPTIGTEYTNIFYGLTGSRAAYYTGEFEGDMINYEDEWNERNFNPYLFPTASITGQPLNVFNHSDFNVLFNNISSSLLSSTRRLLESIYAINSPLSLVGYSSSYFAELQDSYESLTTYNNARYDGSKISSLLYNTYTSASLTYGGDKSFGKTTSIDKNVRKIGLFTEIVSSSLLPGRNRVSLKYLVDEFGGLTELNQRNKHWEEVQRTFVASEYLNISQFDNQKYSNQKTTDGDKLIFDSGYSYYPILYFTSSCDANQKIYFESIGESNSFLVRAYNSQTNNYISGSTTIPGYPVNNGVIYNIFNTEREDLGNSFTPGNLSSFPTYSVQESGDYRVEANFDITVDMPLGGTSTWVLNLFKNNTLVDSNEQTITTTNSATSSAQASILYSDSLTSISNTTVTSNKPILIDTTNYPAGTTFYKWNYNLATSSTYPAQPDCNFSYFSPWYSTINPGTVNAIGETCPDGFGGSVKIFEPFTTFYLIPNFDSPTAAQTKTLSINRTLSNPITSVDQGDQLILHLSQSNLSTNNYTASISEGNLIISSLAVATGYANTSCPYFNSSSLSASIAAGLSSNIITFSSGISNFYNSGYQFIPNPLTGSLNPLYPEYGDVDYNFNINPFDIITTYLSDGTYVESRVLSSSVSDGLVQIYLNNTLSSLYSNDIMSGSYQKFLVLKRVEDETNAYLTFKKRDGKTSYGFTIPNNLSSEVLDNIDTITREVKQKLLADQQGLTT